ncbi:RE2, partial [Symbiodinium sp. KB8]
MAGPRLVAELQGAAKRMVVGKAPDWVSFNGGVEVLMQQLRTCLGRPQVAELTDYLSQYFRHSRRRSGESINDYVTRKSELYMRAQQALSRVRPHQEATATAGLGSGDGFRGTQRRSSWTSETTTTTVPEGDDVADEAATETGTTWNWEGASQGGGWTSGPTWGGYSGPSWWQSSSWNWAGSRDYAGYWPAKGLSDAKKVELLPEWVQGWYLLQDAGLTTNERNMVFTALKGDFSVQKMAQELRNQWSEQDLKRRDQHQKASGYLGETAEDLEDDSDLYEAWKAGDQESQDGDLNDEGSALIAEAEGEARQAWATLQHARRTLKEARQKQHQVRMSRKYYGPSGGGSKPNPRPRDDSQMTCMGCGKIGHRIANCPDKHKAHAAEAQEAAPFVCYVEQALAGSQGDGPTGPVPTTAEAVQDGWGVIDGGATRTLGSVQAIESVMQKNMNKRGQSGIKGVDVENRPVFGFADSGEARCVSTVDLGLQANGQDGKLRVHALNKGTGPILISISTLRTLGAIIDFEQDMMVLRHLDARKVIPLRRSTTGHQLVNLTEDLYQDARATKVQLRAAITTFGEIPAESWNMAELRHRLRELMDEQDIEWANPSAKRATPLQQQITQLNKNKKKKADLVEYLEKVLNLPVSPNETMAQMENRAMNHLYSTVQSTSQDVVGFGRHAHLTYAELVRDFPQYVEWVKQTHRETAETNVRLKRLATWLLRATDVSSPVRAEEPEPETAQTSGAASSRTTPFPSEQMELMHGMMETMKQMQAELKEMKEQSLGSEAINQRSEAVADMKFGQQRSMARDESSRYQTFGMYSHGNHYGITSKTTVLPQVTKYMNQWLREHLPKNARWSSFVVSKNARLPVHRDNHNDPTHSNYLLGVGSYEGGELWVETPPGYEGPDACVIRRETLRGAKDPDTVPVHRVLPAGLARNVPLEGNQVSARNIGPGNGGSETGTLEELGNLFTCGVLRQGNKDYTEQAPSPAEWHRAQDVTQEELGDLDEMAMEESGGMVGISARARMGALTGQKAKARAVLLGYQDPKYEHRATTAPVMTRQTRQMQLQLTTMRKWQLQKGDVSGAFLQGREYPDELFCVPCPEICQAMGLAEGTVTRLRRACYGLVDAPLEWYRTVDSFLQELGLE